MSELLYQISIPIHKTSPTQPDSAGSLQSVVMELWERRAVTVLLVYISSYVCTYIRVVIIVRRTDIRVQNQQPYLGALAQPSPEKCCPVYVIQDSESPLFWGWPIMCALGYVL